jgi:hypothetical protein
MVILPGLGRAGSTDIVSQSQGRLLDNERNRALLGNFESISELMLRSRLILGAADGPATGSRCQSDIISDRANCFSQSLELDRFG